MAKQDQQLAKKLDSWVAAGLIDGGQATAIRAHESKANPPRPWGIIVFAGFGAVVLGLGIILMFAYNWAAMPKFAKLGVVFTSLALAHGIGLHLRRKDPASGFAEAVSLLGTMLFGAGIWLVAQIYHISAHYPNAYFAWAAGALLLAWALPSISHGILAAALLAIWACTEAIGFNNPMLHAPLGILIGVGVLAWERRSAVLLATAAATFAFTSVVTCSSDGSGIAMVLTGLALFYAGLAWYARGQTSLPQAAAILRFIGLLGYFPILFVLTFHDAAEDILRDHRWAWGTGDWHYWLPCLMYPLAGIATAVAAIAKPVDGAGRRWSATMRGHLLAPLVLTVVYLSAWTTGWLVPEVADPSANSFTKANKLELLGLAVCVTATLIYLYHTVANLWIGCKETRLKQVVGGSLLLAAWVFARFADMFDSLLARGIMFMVMGAALFTVAIIYHKQKSRAEAPGDATPAAEPPAKGS